MKTGIISKELSRQFFLKQIIIGLFLFSTVYFFIHPHTAVSQINKRICTVQVKEYPGKDPAMWDGLYAASDGKVYTGLITERESAHFYMYDPVKDVNTLLYDIADVLDERGKGIRASGKIHNKPVEDNEGNIYFVSMNNGSGPRNIDITSWQGGHWFKYDPKENQLENMGLVDIAIGLYPLAIDKERMYLFGTGYTGYFYRFDIRNRVTKNLGRVSNWDICRNIFCDDKGNVYGSFPVARMWKYDAVEERIIDLSVKIPHDPTIYPTRLLNPKIDRTYIWRAVEWDPVDKVAYGITCGSGSILFRYDPHDGPEGKVTELTKMCHGKYYNTGRKDIPYSPLAFAVDSKNKKVYFVPSARNYSLGEYVETFGSHEYHHLIMYDIKTEKRVDLGALQTSDGRRVFGCEGASVDPDGILYICGQVEVRDPKKATRLAGGVPVALHLIVYGGE
jgi:hypothetical protein